MQQPEKLLRHAVLFAFEPQATPEDITSVQAAFAALPSQIPEIVGFEWGLNNSPEGLADGFTHLFFLSFRDEDGRDKYLPHPAHKAFGVLLRPHLEKVLVFDYWAQS